MTTYLSQLPAIINSITEFVKNAGFSESTFIASILIVTLVGVVYIIRSDKATPQKIAVTFVSIALSIYTIGWVATKSNTEDGERELSRLQSVKFHRDYVDGAGFMKLVSGTIRRVTPLQWKEEHDQEDNGTREVHRFELVAESADGVVLAEGRPDCYALLRVSRQTNAVYFKCIGAGDEFQKIYDASDYAFASDEPRAVSRVAIGD